MNFAEEVGCRKYCLPLYLFQEKLFGYFMIQETVSMTFFTDRFTRKPFLYRRVRVFLFPDLSFRLRFIVVENPC